MFFALSGFLVAGSLDRAKNVFDFICLRLLRILPALWLVVILAALGLGPLVTSYSTGEYFSDSQFILYFLTFFGNVQNELPGVFENNTFPNIVNGQLWTIPLELSCYALLGFTALLGIYRRPTLFLAVFIAGQTAFGLRAFLVPVIWGGVPPSVLLICFLAGSVMNVYRAKIPFRLDLACLCGASGFGMIYLSGGSYFIAAPVAYFTIYLGLFNPKKMLLVSSGDYSYGIYLFAFPVQQWIAYLEGRDAPWYANLLLALPLAFVCAVMSWHLVEKRALLLRRHIPEFHRRVLRVLLIKEKMVYNDSSTDKN